MAIAPRSLYRLLAGAGRVSPDFLCILKQFSRLQCEAIFARISREPVQAANQLVGAVQRGIQNADR